MFPFQQFDYLRFPDKDNPSKRTEIVDGERATKGAHLFANENWNVSRDMNSFGSAFRFNQDLVNTAEEGTIFSKYNQEQKLRQLVDSGCFNDLYYDVVTPFQSCVEEIKKLVGSENADLVEPKEESSYSESLKLLKNYGSRFRRLNAEEVKVPSYDKESVYVSGRKLSTNAIIRLAGEMFIQGSSQEGCESSMLSHPYASSFLRLSEEAMNDVQLVQYLLASAENVGQKQFDRASKFLYVCDQLSSDRGNPIERLVFYFSGALHERIDRENGTVTPKGLGKQQSLDIVESLMGPKPDILAMQKQVPFSQVCQFAGIQAILDHVAGATKVHIIDLEIRMGVHYTILMHALATRCEGPPEYLKISAVGTKSKAKIEETGRRLSSFAQSLNLQFSFDIVMVKDFLDFNKNLFEINAKEAVAVYAEYVFVFMIARQDRLESLMTVMKEIKPRIVIVTDVEGNHNSPVFVNRFIETLFHYGAFFDCLEDCMKQDEVNRRYTESVYFSQAIRNIVAAEGEERTIRHVPISVWRAFFARFGMIEVEFSMSSLYQASLVLKNFPNGSFCTIDNDGKCLLIGWKGTPMQSLSAWKFR